MASHLLSPRGGAESWGAWKNSCFYKPIICSPLWYSQLFDPNFLFPLCPSPHLPRSPLGYTSVFTVQHEQKWKPAGPKQRFSQASEISTRFSGVPSLLEYHMTQEASVTFRLTPEWEFMWHRREPGPATHLVTPGTPLWFGLVCYTAWSHHKLINTCLL